MSKTENTNTKTKQQETTNSKIDISTIDYDALACGSWMLTKVTGQSPAAKKS